MANIYCDLDGVVAMFLPKIREIVGKPDLRLTSYNFENLSEVEKEAIYAWLYSDKEALEVELEESVAINLKWFDSKGNRVTFITSRHPNKVANTQAWLKKHGLGFPVIFVDGKPKSQFIENEDYNVFIDDCPNNITDMLTNCPKVKTIAFMADGTWYDGIEELGATVAIPDSLFIALWRACYGK